MAQLSEIACLHQFRCDNLRAAMDNSTEVQQLNSVQYLYLRKLSEPRGHSLKIVAEEAVVNRAGVIGHEILERPELTAILKGASPIESVEGCRVFELYWEYYAAYLVTNESVGFGSAKGYNDEHYVGKVLRIYSRSHFLDHIARNTGGHIKPLLHYKLICLNHLVDVAAYAPPDVQALASGAG